ncbi:MAG: hypothetical protein IJ466_11740 [Clostridia bacterium]|nr:hypothetical protein [Clostridia bacterium]
MGIILLILFFVCLHRCTADDIMPLAYLVFEWLLIFCLILAAAMLE